MGDERQVFRWMWTPTTSGRSGRRPRRDRGQARLRSERGVELVEFGLVAILLFVLVFGITEFGRAVWIYGTTAHLAREGARYAIVRGADSGRAVTADDVEDYVNSRAAGMTDLTVTTTWPDGDNEFRSTVEVRVTRPFETVVSFVGIGPITLGSTSRLVISF